MTHELSRRQSRVEVPQPQGFVPGRGKSELTIGRDDDIRNKVIMTMKYLLGKAECGVVSRQLPYDDRLVWSRDMSLIYMAGTSFAPKLIRGRGNISEKGITP